MTIKLLLSNQTEIQDLTPSAFEKLMGIAYLPTLQFQTFALQQKIIEECAKGERKRWIDPRQKWLGNYYSQEVQSHLHPDITIAWIDPTLGYGVFTNRAILRQTFVGEYTGIVRKRRLFGRFKNDYCFDYTIGLGRETPYVIDAERHGNFTRYINHSEEPNLEAASALSNGIMHMIFYAIIDIPPGAQLSCNYGAKYWQRRKRPELLSHYYA